jgi:hypothetical protein
MRSNHETAMTKLLKAAIVGLGLVWAQAALAEPMKCSGEQKTCISNCNKTLNRALISACVTDCSTREAICVRTGCWDNGTNRYCGLLRQ